MRHDADEILLEAFHSGGVRSVMKKNAAGESVASLNRKGRYVEKPVTGSGSEMKPVRAAGEQGLPGRRRIARLQALCKKRSGR